MLDRQRRGGRPGCVRRCRRRLHSRSLRARTELHSTAAHSDGMRWRRSRRGSLQPWPARPSRPAVADLDDAVGACRPPSTASSARTSWPATSSTSASTPAACACGGAARHGRCGGDLADRDDRWRADDPRDDLGRAGSAGRPLRHRHRHGRRAALGRKSQRFEAARRRRASIRRPGSIRRRGSMRWAWRARRGGGCRRPWRTTAGGALGGIGTAVVVTLRRTDRPRRRGRLQLAAPGAASVRDVPPDRPVAPVEERGEDQQVDHHRDAQLLTLVHFGSDAHAGRPTRRALPGRRCRACRRRR